jgi:beta-lactamase class A
MATKVIRKILIVVMIGAFLIGGVYSFRRYRAYLQNLRIQQAILEQRKAAWEQLKPRLDSEIRRFKGEVGIVVKDLRFDWEFSRNEEKLFPSASLVKIPIMVACFIAAEEGRVNLGRKIILCKTDKYPGSGVLKDVCPGTVFTVQELIGLMIDDSDNTATNMLTSMLGINYLNSVFDRLGLKNTNLSRRVADFESRDRGIENYTTAQDIGGLLEQIYRRNLISQRLSNKCLKVLKMQRVRDRIPKYLPANTPVAHKTGLERNVCHDAGIVFGRQGDLLVCVLTRHARPSAAASKNFIARIALCTYLYSEQTPAK